MNECLVGARLPAIGFIRRPIYRQIRRHRGQARSYSDRGVSEKTPNPWKRGAPEKNTELQERPGWRSTLFARRLYCRWIDVAWQIALANKLAPTGRLAFFCITPDISPALHISYSAALIRF